MCFVNYALVFDDYHYLEKHRMYDVDLHNLKY
jgi:hypothetical protein